MKRKIIGIVVYMLLIDITVSVVGVTNWVKGKNPESIIIFKNTSTNYPPVFGIPAPANGSIINLLSFYWIIPIFDLEGDLFSWSIHCSNGQHNNGINASNGTKPLPLSGLAYSTTYKVWVNATDPTGSGLYTHKWYTFTTKANLPPVLGTPSPANGSTDQPLNLTWSIPITDPEGNTITWTIQCSNGQHNNGTGASNGTKSLTLSGFTNATTYKVWVNATDPIGSGLYTRKWYYFTTHEQHNPNKPSTPSGPSSGKPRISYTYQTSTTDPDGDKVYYMWDWADGTPLTWDGPYNSSQTAAASHKWSGKGTYSIKVKAKDTNGAESIWSDPLPITMPYSYNKSMPQLIELLFKQFPNVFSLLPQLIRF